MKQNLKDALGLMSEALDELHGRINLARDRLALKARSAAEGSARLADGLDGEREKVRLALSKVRELSVAVKNGEI
jgi:hypothetical protein